MNSEETIKIVNAVLLHAATIGTRVQGINQIDSEQYSDKASVSFFDGMGHRTFELNFTDAHSGNPQWEVQAPKEKEFDSYLEANSHAHAVANYSGASVVIEWRDNVKQDAGGYRVRDIAENEWRGRGSELILPYRG